MASEGLSRRVMQAIQLGAALAMVPAVGCGGGTAETTPPSDDTALKPVETPKEADTSQAWAWSNGQVCTPGPVCVEVDAGTECPTHLEACEQLVKAQDPASEQCAPRMTGACMSAGESKTSCCYAEVELRVIIGRPFTVYDLARTAPAAHRTDWV
ncbi:MAG: hypothetical protein ACE366_21165 [Bradymonadia bacterium]